MTPPWAYIPPARNNGPPCRADSPNSPVLHPRQNRVTSGRPVKARPPVEFALTPAFCALARAAATRRRTWPEFCSVSPQATFAEQVSSTGNAHQIPQSCRNAGSESEARIFPVAIAGRLCFPPCRGKMAREGSPGVIPQGQGFIAAHHLKSRPGNSQHLAVLTARDSVTTPAPPKVSRPVPSMASREKHPEVHSRNPRPKWASEEFFAGH